MGEIGTARVKGRNRGRRRKVDDGSLGVAEAREKKENKESYFDKQTQIYCY